MVFYKILVEIMSDSIQAYAEIQTVSCKPTSAREQADRSSSSNISAVCVIAVAPFYSFQ